MNTRRSIFLGLALLALAGLVLVTTRSAALEPARSALTNQVFYSPSIEKMVNVARAERVPNQVLYSPAIEKMLKQEIPWIDGAPAPAEAGEGSEGRGEVALEIDRLRLLEAQISIRPTNGMILT